MAFEIIKLTYLFKLTYLLGVFILGLLAAGAKRLVKKTGFCTSQMTGWEGRLQNKMQGMEIARKYHCCCRNPYL